MDRVNFQTASRGSGNSGDWSKIMVLVTFRQRFFASTHKVLRMRFPGFVQWSSEEWTVASGLYSAG